MTNGNGSTILIADDEPDLRDAIAFDFKRKGFTVLTADCGEKAIDIIKSNKVDLVLSDVRMPNGDGLTILDFVKSQNVTMPVVMFITGFADISLEEAYDRGADAVFSKPFDRKVLMEAVLRAIQPMSERYNRKASRVSVEIPVGLTFAGKTLPIDAKVKNIGRGGMFVELVGDLPVLKQEVEFRILTSLEGVSEISGTGVVRWLREKGKPGEPSGCGVEFTNFDASCLSQVVHLINFLKTKSFIPRNS